MALRFKGWVVSQQGVSQSVQSRKSQRTGEQRPVRPTLLWHTNSLCVGCQRSASDLAPCCSHQAASLRWTSRFSFYFNEPPLRISVLASPEHILLFLWYVHVPLGLKEERCVIDGPVIGWVNSSDLHSLCVFPVWVLVPQPVRGIRFDLIPPADSSVTPARAGVSPCAFLNSLIKTSDLRCLLLRWFSRSLPFSLSVYFKPRSPSPSFFLFAFLGRFVFAPWFLCS